LQASHRSRRKPFFFSTAFLPFFSPFLCCSAIPSLYSDSAVGCASFRTWIHVFACTSVFLF
jgi:hypothetical protein